MVEPCVIDPKLITFTLPNQHDPKIFLEPIFKRNKQALISIPFSLINDTIMNLAIETQQELPKI